MLVRPGSCLDGQNPFSLGFRGWGLGLRDEREGQNPKPKPTQSAFPVWQCNVSGWQHVRMEGTQFLKYASCPVRTRRHAVLCSGLVSKIACVRKQALQVKDAGACRLISTRYWRRPGRKGLGLKP